MDASIIELSIVSQSLLAPEGSCPEFRFSVLPERVQNLIYSSFSLRDAHSSIGVSRGFAAFIGSANLSNPLVTIATSISGSRIQSIKKFVIIKRKEQQTVNSRIAKLLWFIRHMNQIDIVTFKLGTTLLIPSIVCLVVGGYQNRYKNEIESKIVVAGAILGAISVVLLIF